MKSVDDLWNDLFLVEGITDNSPADRETSIEPRKVAGLQCHVKSRSVADVSALAKAGSALPAQKLRLLDSSAVARVNRRVASVNIPGIISRFDTNATGYPGLASLVVDSPDDKQAKDSLNSSKEISTLTQVNREAKDAESTPKQSLQDNRRYCIVDNFLFNSARPLSDKLNACVERFKSTLLDCEKDMIDLTDNVRLKAFSHISFLGTKKFDMKGYLQLFQSVIEMLISHFRGVDVVKSLSKRSNLSFATTKHPLKSDVVFMAVRQVLNFESVLLFFELYFKVLILATNLDRAEHIGRLALTIAYIADICHFKIEAYSMLGQVFEKKRMTESALFCYTRSMQFCLEAKDKTREFYMCDKIGIQLYYLNEMALAKEYHERMLISFEEPELSNAILRSKEILEIDNNKVKSRYLLRNQSMLDKYRATDMLLSLQVPPCDELLTIDRDDSDNPVVLNFIDLMLTNQRRQMENVRMKKMSFIKDSLFGKSNRDFENNRKKKQPSIKVNFTNEGKKSLIDCNEYIPKISANLLGMSLKTPLRMTHQKNNNNLLNYLNQNFQKVQDFEHVKTKALEIQKKNSTEDILMFLTRARYFVMRKINEATNVKASKYHRMLRPSTKHGGSSAFLISKK